MTVHILGYPIRIGNRLIQRCMICGDKLIDTTSTYTPRIAGSFVNKTDLENGAWRLDYSDNSIATFKSPEELPPNNCLGLIE